ncbi:hypothetical protein [Clostridium folliculivorans]|uniref:Uncharacterized protein n=1 Tax=Clostridium folliculivorans TaxID=2886038 RepID=A0A9W5Y1Q8_9CLOT|nr:hypothetical protein [Clostridium folliculivorans]GKU25101.1 hypothetical protein CFOLD11_19270 [Clostridium folliculivorans]GKU31199.1 hypothetical protein CFB3_33060 [Clostridium folliculivorans]
MGIFLYLIGIISAYFIIKLAVKHAIEESLEDIRGTVKEAITGGLYEYKRRNQDN